MASKVQDNWVKGALGVFATIVAEMKHLSITVFILAPGSQICDVRAEFCGLCFLVAREVELHP